MTWGQARKVVSEALTGHAPLKRLQAGRIVLLSACEAESPNDAANGLYRGEAVLRVKGIERGEELLDLL
ncbi:MAG: hypothetical protein IPN01_31670 [Deltaproteobacteria bacterium]|nr:hypothetical protein [Deltaproteobacteria bacterium]